VKPVSPDLIPLYDQLQKHTFKDCVKFCNSIASCCQPAYCEKTRTFAAEQYGITLEDTGLHPTLPFMTDTGCSVAPHLRPECTEYSCTIREIGKRLGDATWTTEYYAIRRKILNIQIASRVVR
jgi:hypothetical protein